MAISNFIKFSLLTIAVVLSSYVCYTEALTPCDVPDSPDSVQLLTAYNCTVDRGAAEINSCTAPKCPKALPIIIYLRTTLYIALSNLLGGCHSCSPTLVQLVVAILKLIVIVIKVVLEILQLVVITVIIIVAKIAIIIAQILVCVGLLNIIGGLLGQILISVLYGLHDLVLKILLALV